MRGVKTGEDTCVAGQNRFIQLAYDTHFREINFFIRSRVRCKLVSQDLTQDVFLKFSSAALRSKIENPRAFLYRSAKNIVIDHYRSERLRHCEMVDIGEVGDQLPGEDISVERQFISKQTLSNVLVEISMMPPLRQAILDLHFFQGKKQADIAELLNVCQSTVEKNIHSARKHFHSAIELH